jgi:tripartite motif-containing protein 71
MPEDQDNQIERREPGGISRWSESTRRGSDAAGFVRGLANRRTGSNLPSTISTYEFSLKWGTEGEGDGQFHGPFDVAVASDGSVYVADFRNNRIQRFTSEGVFLSKWGGQVPDAGDESLPAHVAVGPDGSVYVAYGFNQPIQKFTSEGVFLRQWGTEGSDDGQFPYLADIAVGPDGSVYVVDRENNLIQKFTSEGVLITKWGSVGRVDGEFDGLGGRGDGELSWPGAIEVAPDGSVYLADLGNERIQKFTSGGAFLNKWDVNFGGYTWRENFTGITVTPDGIVHFVSFTDFDPAIQKFTSEGVSLGQWGTRGSGDGEFARPQGLAVGPDGSFYVADIANRRIQKFSPRT